MKRYNAKEIWKSTYDGKPMITIVDRLTGETMEFVLFSKGTLPKNSDSSIDMEYIDTDEYYGRNGFKRARTYEELMQ